MLLFSKHFVVFKMSDEDSEKYTKQETEELLLYSSRHGDAKMVAELLSTKEKQLLTFDINCKGVFSENT